MGARMLGMEGKDGELPSIKEMKKIKMLQVRNQGLPELPEVLWECPGVLEADLHGNHIKDISEGLSVWTGLDYWILQ